jgi:hypothetical protein
VERLGPRFRDLQDGFDAGRPRLATDLAEADPEQVLVLETIGTVADFVRATQRIEGFEYLGEFDEEDIAPDEDFYSDKDPDKSLTGTLYLLMTNQHALDQLLSLWRRYSDNPEESFDWGLNRFRTVFNLLREIRPWGVEDRLRDTGLLEDWQQRSAAGGESVPVEIELWYRDDDRRRAASEREVRAYIDRAGGEVVTSSIIPEIRYHALLAQLPVGVVQPLFEDVDDLELVRSDRVMFLRPTGQSLTTSELQVGLPDTRPEPEVNLVDEPVVAVLDGVPLEQHAQLSGALIVDDPDDLASRAPARQRRHGTAMASLVYRGDLNYDSEPLVRRLYLRPILVPGPDWVAGAPESVPDDILAVDLVHTAVRRLYEGSAGADPVAPNVRVINLALGDANAPFSQMVSSWARLIDWLAWEYQALVVVSAGNHAGEFAIPISRDAFNEATGSEVQRHALVAIAESSQDRRLLPPAEAVNALTVGAANEDGSTLPDDHVRRELIASPALPAPYNPIGHGYRRGIKPDVLVAGGRRLYAVDEGSSAADEIVLRGSDTPLSPPGQLVASPLGPAGALEGRCFSYGTSNAAAVATRTAAQLYEVLQNVEGSTPPAFLRDDGVVACLLKALLVHGAAFREANDLLNEAIGNRVERRRFREYATRFVGYGSVDPTYALGSTPTRATLIGGGHLEADTASVFTVPLPPSLSGKPVMRRLTITLAWLTPINTRDRRYRRALLWFEPPRAELRVDRSDADWQAAQRGTVQHEILEGQQAAVFGDSATLSIRVNCASHAGALDDPVPYGLAVSVEVAPEIEVPVFTEIRDRIRPLITVRPGT